MNHEDALALIVREPARKIHTQFQQTFYSVKSRVDVHVTLFICFVVTLVASGVVLVMALANEGRKWEQFKTEHNCKVVAKISGDVFTTTSVGANGQVQFGLGSTPDKTGWLCDDGVTYYR